jgi:hypothetical protein
VLKRSFRLELRCRGASWKEAWVQTEAQNGANVADKKVRRLKTHTVQVVKQRVEKLNRLKRSWLNNTLEISNGFDLTVLQITSTQECDKSLSSKLQPQ